MLQYNFTVSVDTAVVKAVGVAGNESKKKEESAGAGERQQQQRKEEAIDKFSFQDLPVNLRYCTHLLYPRTKSGMRRTVAPPPPP